MGPRLGRCPLSSTGASLLPHYPIYGTEDPRGLTASLNTGYNNFNLAYHRCNQPPNAGNYYCCVGATDYEDPYYGKVSRKFERKKEAITVSRLAPESVMQARGVVASIPMPGHGCAPDEALQRDVEQLEALISEADAVFSVLDSRESRWLPTLLCSKLNKLHITTALGFASFLVIFVLPS